MRNSLAQGSLRTTPRTNRLCRGTRPSKVTGHQALKGSCRLSVSFALTPPRELASLRPLPATVHAQGVSAPCWLNQKTTYVSAISHQRAQPQFYSAEEGARHLVAHRQAAEHHAGGQRNHPQQITEPAAAQFHPATGAIKFPRGLHCAPGKVPALRRHGLNIPISPSSLRGNE
jgi:hypothetical protein